MALMIIIMKLLHFHQIHSNTSYTFAYIINASRDYFRGYIEEVKISERDEKKRKTVLESPSHYHQQCNIERY